MKCVMSNNLRIISGPLSSFFMNFQPHLNQTTICHHVTDVSAEKKKDVDMGWELFCLIMSNYVLQINSFIYDINHLFFFFACFRL